MSNYLNDDIFTACILRDKESGKLSQESVEMFCTISKNLLYRNSYNCYDIAIKQDMDSLARLNFVRYWKTFSIYKKEVKNFLKPYGEKKKIGRNTFYIYLSDIINKIENNDDFKEALSPFVLTKYETELFTSLVNELRENKEKKGAYSFFTALCENAFVETIKEHYKNHNLITTLYEQMSLNDFDRMEEEEEEDMADVKLGHVKHLVEQLSAILLPLKKEFEDLNSNLSDVGVLKKILNYIKEHGFHPYSKAASFEYRDFIDKRWARDDKNLTQDLTNFMQVSLEYFNEKYIVKREGRLPLTSLAESFMRVNKMGTRSKEFFRSGIGDDRFLFDNIIVPENTFNSLEKYVKENGANYIVYEERKDNENKMSFETFADHIKKYVEDKPFSNLKLDDSVGGLFDYLKERISLNVDSKDKTMGLLIESLLNNINNEKEKMRIKLGNDKFKYSTKVSGMDIGEESDMEIDAPAIGE